jgi:hypothetical protein
MPHPDGKMSKVVCTNDPETKELLGPQLSVYGDEQVAGVIQCGQYTVLRVSARASMWADVNLNVATVESYMTYKFVPDPMQSGELALYEIQIRSNVGNWDKFWDGYTTKYGKPKLVSNQPIQNGAGATFDNTIATWENDQSTITLTKRFSRVDNTYIFYEHLRLSGEVKRRVEQKNGRPSDNL